MVKEPPFVTANGGRLGCVGATIVLVAALVDRGAGWTQPYFYGNWNDDLFYYAKIAENIVAGHGSTFDGETATNGYQPLWQLLFVGLVFLLGDALSAIRFGMLPIVGMGAAVTFLVSRRVTALLLRSDGLTSVLVALVSLPLYYVVARRGMEVILAVPLLLWLVALRLEDRIPGRSTRSLVATGLLVSLVGLTRLDGLLAVVLLAVGYALASRDSLVASASKAARVCVGLLPLVGYLGWNLYGYGALVPVSGAAKQLATLSWSDVTLRGYFVAPIINLVLVYPTIALCTLALVKGACQWRSASREVRITIPLLVFPFVFYIIQSRLSDWGFWGWYLYPWQVCLPLAVGVLLLGLRPWVVELDRRFDRLLNRAVGWVVVGLLGVALVTPFALRATRPLFHYAILDFAYALRGFASTHPGRFAMGDRAGMPGLFLGHPLVQLEGLVGDRAFLEHIRRRRNLNEVLSELRIDYYASAAAELDGNCYTTREPQQGGRLSPKMVGRFCSEPAFIHAGLDGVTTYVFAIPQRSSPTL